MVVNPFCAWGKVFGRAFDDELVVEEELDVVGRPLDFIEVEGVVDLLAGGEDVFGRRALGSAVAGAVDGAVHRVGRADGLEDVDLTAVGPAVVLVVVTEEPPTLKDPLGSNLCFVSARVDERTGWLIALSSLDNLGKGAAGQAIQAWNVATGREETLGLALAGVNP